MRGSGERSAARAARTVGLAWIAAAGYGCAGSAEGVPTAEVLDSAGVRVLVYDLASVSVPTYRVVGEHDLLIGVQDGAPEYTFSRIPDLAVTQDGSIVVSDGVAQELRVYDASGVYLRTIGQRGEGPGEFSAAPTIAGMAGDTVVAFDARSGRVSLFTLNGDLLRTTTLQSEAVGRPDSAVRLNDGGYLAQSGWVPRRGEVLGSHDMRLELDSIVITHVDATGALLDTVRVMADQGRARSMQVLANGAVRVQQSTTPYTARAFMLSDGVRPIIARSNALEIGLWNAAGDLETVIRVLGLQHPATADDIRVRQEAAIRESLGDREIDPTILRLNLEFLPERLPAFRSIVVAADRDIWVSMSEFDASGGYDWLVFAPSGELRGMVHTPPDFQLYEIRDDFIVGVALDELDVPYVRRYPLLEDRDGGDGST